MDEKTHNTYDKLAAITLKYLRKAHIKSILEPKMCGKDYIENMCNSPLYKKMEEIENAEDGPSKT
jgi:hypothetical protein